MLVRRVVPVHLTEDPVPIPCSQFVRRAAALLPMLVMLVMALATPAVAQKTKTTPPPSSVSFSDATAGTTGAARLTASYGGSSGGGSPNVSVKRSFGVSVTPDNQSQVVSPGATLTFRVTNTGTVATTYSITANCTPQCTVSPLTLSSVSPGASMGRNVTVGLGTYFGTVVVTASGSGVSDTGSIIPSAASYTVGVGPDGSPDFWFEAGQAGTANFTVSNSGNSAATYSLSGSCDAVATGCSVAPASVAVSPSSSAPVPITFTAGPPGSSGYVRLNASGPSSDGGTVHVLVYSHTPAVGAPAAVSVDPGSYTASFSVTNNGNVSTTYNLASTCGAPITGCTASLGQITVAAGATSPPVSVPYTAVNRGDAGTVTLTASWVGNGAVNASAAMSVSVKHSYGVAVTPDSQGQIVSPSGSVTFRVANLGSIPTSFNLSVNCACGISPSTSISVPIGGVPSGVDVTVSLNGTTGTVILTASDPAHGTSDTGSIIITAATYTVGVGPDGLPDFWFEAGQAGTATFTVSNVGNSPATYSLSRICDPVATGCSVSPASVTVNPSPAPPASVPITFTAGVAGSSGYVRLNASGPSSDGGTVHVLVYNHAVSVAKGGTATVYSGPGLTQVINVTNTGNVLNSYSLTPSCSGAAVSPCTASPASVSNLGIGATQQVTVTYTGANAGGAGIVQLVARNTVNTAIADSGTVNITVKPTYTVAVTPDGGTAQADAWTMASVPFAVTNNGTAASGRYTLVPTCTGTAVKSVCTLDSTSVTISRGLSTQVKVSFQAGAPKDTAAIQILAKSADDSVFQDTGTSRLTVTTYAVSVTPDTLPVTPSAYATDTRTFMVTNAGTTQRTFRLQAACAPPAATACSASRDTVTLVANSGSVAVNVSYTAGDPGTAGTVRLVATDTLGRSADGGSLAVTVGTSVAVNKVFVNEVNPGTTIERSACLVFSIVADVADECGALRIVHPLPAVRTLGKARVPTLLYSSDQVQGPTLAVNVILADTTTIPQFVQLLVSRTGPYARRDSASFAGSDWQVNRRRRIAMPIVTTGSTVILPYTVEVHLQYAGSAPLAAPAVSGELAVVDRSSSHFGGGWWLAGLEQLFPGQYDGSVLWVAGDGSTRKYVDQHTMSGADTVYLAPALDRPDTLLHRADSTYQRHAGNGLFVEFDGFGLHKRTVNRLGYATVFTYDGDRLSSIQLPPLQAGGGPAFTYTFAYNATSGLLDTVTAPPVNGIRKVALTRNGATRGVQTITELLGNSTYSVGFEFPAGGALTYAARLDRRNVRTSFAYEASSPTIASFATATGTGTDTVRHTFRTAGAVGAAGASANLDTVYFRYDGPRPAAVGDTTLFWLDRFGAPARIVDAMGHETRIARGDPRFPGLATEVRGPAPKTFTTWATYDDRGNLRASTEVNPHGDAIPIDATTTYLWHPKWDMDTLIVQPEGEITHIGYDSNGNRVYQEDGRGLMSRVSFQYYTNTDPASGAMAGLVSTVTLPATAALASATTQIQYDNLGNVKNSITPLGFWSRTTNDSIGRTVQTANQINSALDSSTTTLTYDLSDRVTKSVSYGPAMNGAGAQSAIVDNAYDREGRLTKVTRTQTPDTSRVFGQTYPALGGLVLRYQYDDLGRKLAEIAPDSTASDSTDNPVDYSFYDLAGNVTSVQTRRNDHVLQGDVNHVIQMTYDVLNRLKTRTVPEAKYTARFDGYAKSLQSNLTDQRNAPYPRFPNNAFPDTAAHNYLYYTTWGGYTVSGDTATFDYDAAGNMTKADNADARVHRQYYPNGQVQLDSLYTQTLERDTTKLHKYGLEYLYDRDGRQTTLKHPVELSPAAFVTKSQYDPITGTLLKVIDPLGYTFTYGSDERSQTISLAMPFNFNERYGYDQDGNQLTQWSGDAAGALHDVTMTYDPRGKMLTLGNAVAGHQTVTLRYSGLGNLIYSDNIKWLRSDGLTRQRDTESFTYDPLGNRLHSDLADTTQDQQTNCGFWLPCHSSYNTNLLHSDWYYRTGTGRLVFDNHDTNVGKVTKYDESGNTVFSGQKPDVSNPVSFEDRASYYGADGMLAAVDFRQITDIGGGWKIAFDEYRYDALGRRVFVRSRRLCGFNAKVECTQSYVRRTIWAGSQELYEIQMPDTTILREYDTEPLPTMAADVVNGYDPNPMYGRVAYTFGLKLDQPLTVIRLGYKNSFSETWSPFSIVPLWTVRGTADTSYFAATGAKNCNTSRCVLVGYSSEYWTPAYSRYFVPTMFQGTLLSDKSDHTGQLFRRNRYYDPASGRFTQEDPMGLAGGLNAYGFAGGDPVNFGDPFGLCPKDLGGDGKTPTMADCPEGSAGRRRFISGAAESATDPLFLIFGGLEIKEGEALASGGARLVSRIGENPGLARIAGRLEAGVQESIDRLTAKLAQGNLNPGIGNRFLFKGIFEARARDGARVYFRNAAKGSIEILAKSTKNTQDQVIRILEGLYK